MERKTSVGMPVGQTSQGSWGRDNKHFYVGQCMACEAGWNGITVIVPIKWHRTSGERRDICGEGLDKQFSEQPASWNLHGLRK